MTWGRTAGATGHGSHGRRRVSGGPRRGAGAPDRVGARRRHALAGQPRRDAGFGVAVLVGHRWVGSRRQPIHAGRCAAPGPSAGPLRRPAPRHPKTPTSGPCRLDHIACATPCPPAAMTASGVGSRADGHAALVLDRTSSPRQPKRPWICTGSPPRATTTGGPGDGRRPDVCSRACRTPASSVRSSGSRPRRAIAVGSESRALGRWRPSSITSPGCTRRTASTPADPAPRRGSWACSWRPTTRTRARFAATTR